MVKKTVLLIVFTICFLFNIGCSSTTTAYIEPEFFLIGEDYIEIQVGDIFVDPGFIARSDADLSDFVTINSDFNNEIAGEYLIEYSLLIDTSTLKLERVVKVIGQLAIYFNQFDPGMQPDIFAEGIISTETTSEFSCTFSPDYKYFFFTRRNAYNDNRIFYSEYMDGEWITPSLSPISENISEFEPHITPNGKYLYFNSKRDSHSNYTVYRSDLIEGGWSTPSYFDNKINDDVSFYISVANSQNMYYTTLEGIYVMKYIDGAYSSKVFTGLLGAHAYIDPEETYMLLDDSGLGNENAAIYISINNNGLWGTPIKLNDAINKEGTNNICPMITPDGKYLFFSRFTDQLADIYWVSIEVLNEYH